MTGNFNPRPREEGDGGVYGNSLAISNFNPRPREEGDMRDKIIFKNAMGISIHALVKRATYCRQ